MMRSIFGGNYRDSRARRVTSFGDFRGIRLIYAHPRLSRPELYGVTPLGFGTDDTNDVGSLFFSGLTLSVSGLTPRAIGVRPVGAH